MPERLNDPVFQRQLLDAAESLEAQIPGLQADIKALREANVRNRHSILALGIGGALLLCVVVGLIVALVRVDQAADDANEAAAKATTVQTYQSDACSAGNEQRSAQRELWKYIIDSEIATAERSGEEVPQEELDQVKDLLAYINESFADRDCSRVLTGGQDAGTSPSAAPTLPAAVKSPAR
jgi:hypothetical protein